MLVVVVAAAGGLFGNGLYSRVQRSSGDGRLFLAFQRFARSGAPTTLEISVAPGAADDDDEIEVRLSQEYLRRFRVEQVSPEPASSDTTGASLALVFKVSDAASRLEVQFDLQPQGAGRVRGEVALRDGPPVRFSQFVYP